MRAPAPVAPLRGPSPARARWREGLLALGFLIVLAAAVFTVAIPELAKEPEEGATSPAGGVAKPSK